MTGANIASDEKVTARFLMGRRREQLASAELQVLEERVSAIRELPARKLIARTGDRITESTLLLEGFACRYMDDRAGHRQLVALHIPGDFIDLHGFPLERLDHDLATVTPARVACWRHDVVEEVLNTRPHLMRMMWFSTLLDAAMHREWIFRLGRLDADGRVAHFMCEMAARLAMVGLASEGRFALPLRQTDVAEACGLTGVHVNRVLRVLREKEMLLFRNGEVTILDHRRLSALAEFDPAYLYGSNA